MRFGAHSDDGRYSDITLRFGKAIFRLEFTADGDGSFIYKISPLENCDNLRILAAGPLRWNAPGTVQQGADARRSHTPAGVYRISTAARRETMPINTFYSGLLVAASQTAYIRCNCTDTPILPVCIPKESFENVFIAFQLIISPS